VLLFSTAIVALCGIVYELIIGSVSSYLLGDSVYQFSITIGSFMFAMGIGSYLSKFLGRDLIQSFVYVEVILAVIGGISSIGLFLCFPFAPFLYQIVMFAFLFSIGILVGLEIPIITRVLAVDSGTRQSIANVMSFDYVGALIGSVMFPLFLLPNLGLVRASFAIGLINAFVAMVNVIFLREHLRHPRRMFLLAAGALLVLLVLTAVSSRLTAFAEDKLYFDQVIAREDSPYQKIVVTHDFKRRDLRVFIDGHIQFSQADEHRYHEMLVHPLLSWTGPDGKAVERVLILGGGDGLAVREVLKYASVRHVDIVDIDPAMTRLGATFGPLVALNGDSLADSRVHVHNDDAFVFVNQPGPAYDRVIIDMPDPHNEAISKLYSKEFYTMIARRLSDSGGLVTQSSSPFFARQTYWAIETTLAAVFPQTVSFHSAIPSFGLWGFHIALKRVPEEGFSPVIAVATRALTDAGFQAARVFSKDISALDGLPVNSIFEPTLYQYYIRDLGSTMISPGLTLKPNSSSAS
jgi:spermidine synthase